MKGALIDDLKIQNLRESELSMMLQNTIEKKTGASPYEGIRTCL